jgi:hypothetical protein
MAPFAAARDAAVLAGLSAMAPDLAAELAERGPRLFEVVDALPSVGRVLFAAHRAAPRPTDPVLFGWHAVNCLREWRGDTHWALVVAAGLTHPEASILHNEWLGYEQDWLPTSRGTAPDALAAGWVSLKKKGLVAHGQVTDVALDLRERLEVETDRACIPIWETFGIGDTVAFADGCEPSCVTLLEAVDRTAGPNYQPASRTRRRRG